MANANLHDLLIKYKEHPYELVKIETPHTGKFQLKVKEGTVVYGPRGSWQEIKGTLLYVLGRQGNLRPIYAPLDGSIVEVKIELDGKFVESDEHIMSIKHPMDKEETISKILCDVLHVFKAPDKARYFYSPQLAVKMEKDGQNVVIQPGDEILIMSRMKRDIPLIYHGEPGVIYCTYFSHTRPVDRGNPLLGICPLDKIEEVNRLVQRIRIEWV